MGGGLGGALRRQGRAGDLRAADSPVPTPPGLQVPEVRLEVWGDPNKAKPAGNKKIEVMWYMGLKRGPLQGLCLVFCVLWTARYLLGAPAGYPPPGHAPYRLTLF